MFPEHVVWKRECIMLRNLILGLLLVLAAAASSTRACLIDDDCDDLVACTDDTCEIGVCVYTPNDVSCPDDGLFCNGAEYCDAVNDCSSTGDPCEPPIDFCNEGNDTCEECQYDYECDDLEECTVDYCETGVCFLTPINEGLSCNDGDVCNIGETCQTGVCTGGAPPDCGGAGDQCNDASCDPVGLEGNCDMLVPVIEGLACDDGLACNVGETCQSGMCIGGSSMECSGAGGECYDAWCDPAGVEGNCDTLSPGAEGTARPCGEVCAHRGACRGRAAQFCGVLFGAR